MNVVHGQSSHVAPAADGIAPLKRLGIGVILGFTLKGLITASLLVITLLEFVYR